MQRIGVVAILNQLVGDLLCLLTGTAEDNAIDIGVIVGDAFQGKVFVLRTHHIIDVADILVSLVLHADHDLFRITHVFLRDRSDLFRHRRGEEQHVACLRHRRQDLVDAVGEAHVEHLVRLVEDHVFHRTQIDRLTVHQVDQSSRCSHHHMHTPLQGLDLALDARSAIHRLHTQVLHIFRIVIQIIRDL